MAEYAFKTPSEYKDKVIASTLGVIVVAPGKSHNKTSRAQSDSILRSSSRKSSTARRRSSPAKTPKSNKVIWKIGKKKVLEPEVRQIHSLPNIVGKPYLKKSDIKFTEYKIPNQENIQTALNGLKINDSERPWKIEMPHLGEDFWDYLCNNFYFTQKLNGNCTRGKSENCMTVRVFKKLYNLLVALDISIYNTIKFLNSRNIYHNDIKANNIMYNKREGKMYLIDFGISINKNQDKNNYLHFTSVPGNTYKDIMRFFKEVLMQLLEVSTGNQYIYNNLLLNINEVRQFIHSYREMLDDGRDIVAEADVVIGNLNNAVSLLNSSAPNIKNTSNVVYPRLNEPSTKFSRKKALETNEQNKNLHMMKKEDVRYP